MGIGLLETTQAQATGVGITFGIVATVNEALDDPQMRHAGALVPFADGQGLTVMTPFHIDGVSKTPAARAPSIGQHNEEVYMGLLGMSRERFDALKTAKVI